MTRTGLAAPPTLRIIFKNIFFLVFLPNIKKRKPILTLQSGGYAKRLYQRYLGYKKSIHRGSLFHVRIHV